MIRVENNLLVKYMYLFNFFYFLRKEKSAQMTVNQKDFHSDQIQLNIKMNLQCGQNKLN